MKKLRLAVFVSLGVFLLPVCAEAASASITELMYDLPGTDTGREWIEVQNTGSDDVSFLKWKLFEANTNHGLTLFQGNATTSAGGFAVIADDAAKFLADNPSYSGTLFSSNFSLSNAGETLELKLDGASISQATYASTSGGAGDGNSLHVISNAWEAGVPSPGSETASTPSPQPPSDQGATTATDAANEDGQPSAPPPAHSGGTTWVYKPQIYVSALAPRGGVAGAPVLFDAAAVGTKKEPLPNARYVWSFGDGGTAEGKKVFHTYHYPATYTVLVDASSGEWSATDRKEISIAAPELVLARLGAGEDGFIEVRNDGGSEVDLSGWLLTTPTGLFTIPQGTMIGARKAIPFPAAITQLLADAENTALLYPNGKLVVAYRPASTPPELAPAEVSVPNGAVETSEKEVVPLKPVPELPVKVAQKTVAPPVTLLSVASNTELMGAAGASVGNGILPWLGSVSVLLVISLGGYLLMLLRPKSELSAADALRKEAATYDIIE